MFFYAIKHYYEYFPELDNNYDIGVTKPQLFYIILIIIMKHELRKNRYFELF